MDSVNVWNMDVSEGMALMASNYSIIHKGSQWALHNGRVVYVCEYNGTRCIHLLHESWNYHEEITSPTFLFDDDDRLSCRMS